MFSGEAWLWGLGALAIVMLATWLVSLVKRDVSIVDPVWPLLFLVAAGIYRSATPAPAGARTGLILALVAIWALRLSGYLVWRGWGEPEDRRYAAMRRRQGPRFAVTSLATVFGFQALLAWIISLPLLAAADGRAPVGVLDGLGVALWGVGFCFETLGDFQLARFKADPAHAGRVMDRGLWGYTRHPNYFGDFCVWWGFFLLALGAGGWWSLPGPLLMSFLLLRVSGVTLLEKDIAERRPGYRRYVETTNAFFPGPRGGRS